MPRGPSSLRSLRRAAEVLREEGLRGLWFGILAQTVYRRLDLVELDLERPPAPAEAALPLEFGFLDDAEVEAYAALQSGTSTEEALRRLRRGERCFVARAGERMVSARWLAVGEADVGYLGRMLELAEGEVYVYETYTHPEYRGHAVSAAAGTRLAQRLAREGYRRLLGAVGPENAAGQRAWQKAGYRKVGRVGYLKLGPWRHDFVRLGRGPL